MGSCKLGRKWFGVRRNVLVVIATEEIFKHADWACQISPAQSYHPAEQCRAERGRTAGKLLN
jgi:hypothetical protein